MMILIIKLSKKVLFGIFLELNKQIVMQYYKLIQVKLYYLFQNLMKLIKCG
jgi:hypothetical protein